MKLKEATLKRLIDNKILVFRRSNFEHIREQFEPESFYIFIDEETNKRIKLDFVPFSDKVISGLEVCYGTSEYEILEYKLIRKNNTKEFFQIEKVNEKWKVHGKEEFGEFLYQSELLNPLWKKGLI